MKCSALVVGNCTAPALVDYISRNTDDWGELAIDTIYIGCNLEIDDELWIVQSINENDDKVLIAQSDEFGTEVMAVSIAYCIPHIM